MNGNKARVAITALVVLTVAFMGYLVFSNSNNEARWKDAERRYSEATSAPTPTKIVTTPGPVRTKVVTTPGPTRTIYVERASRGESRSTPSSAGNVHDHPTLACIRKHESTNNYRATNGSYRGAYQMSTTYSDTWAKRAGFSQWASKPANQWPPAVQDAVAWDMSNQGRYWAHWDDHTDYQCPGF